MTIITDQPSTMGDTRFADLKKSRKSMRAFEGKKQDNTGVCMKEQTVVGESKSWRALTLALARSYVFTTPKTKELQSKT